MDPLVQSLCKNLRLHRVLEQPFLLALSGGPDSMALLHLLLECRKEMPFSFAIAHVDHGWREESAQEARALQELAIQYDLPFHCKKLIPQELLGNLEAACRKKRLAFFAELAKRHGYQATLLAHHRDDQAETVFKQLMEGAGLIRSQGMAKEADVEGVRLFRPLLDVPKERLKNWLDRRKIPYFSDTTNNNPRFLRARLRTQLLPEIECRFQKKVGKNLATLGQEAQELRAFFKRHLQSHLDKIVHGPFGQFLDLYGALPEHGNEALSFFEAKELIRQFFGCLSREILEEAAHHLLLGSPNKRFFMRDRLLVIDRGILFTTFKNWEFSEKRWKMKIGEACSEQSDEISKGWRSVWEGNLAIILPLSEIPYRLGPPQLSTLYPRTHSIRKWWNGHQVPAFLRSYFPVIYSGDQVVHEFLTGKQMQKEVLKESGKVKLEIAVDSESFK